MNQPRTLLAIVGGGGHALVVAEAASLAGYTVVGFYDDNPKATLAERAGLKHLGPLRSFDAPRGSVIVAVGDLKTREATIAHWAGKPHAVFANVLHPSAVVHTSATLGHGIYVGPNAVVHSHACVGSHAIINSGSIVEHECMVGENAHIAPGCVLGGNVSVGSGTLVGLGSRILPGVNVGEGVIVGAGSVVVRAATNGQTVAGVPAVPLAA